MIVCFDDVHWFTPLLLRSIAEIAADDDDDDDFDSVILAALY